MDFYGDFYPPRHVLHPYKGGLPDPWMIKHPVPRTRLHRCPLPILYEWMGLVDHFIQVQLHEIDCGFVPKIPFTLQRLERMHVTNSRIAELLRQWDMWGMHGVRITQMMNGPRPVGFGSRNYEDDEDEDDREPPSRRRIEDRDRNDGGRQGGGNRQGDRHNDDRDGGRRGNGRSGRPSSRDRRRRDPSRNRNRTPPSRPRSRNASRHRSKDRDAPQKSGRDRDRRSHSKERHSPRRRSPEQSSHRTRSRNRTPSRERNRKHLPTRTKHTSPSPSRRSPPRDKTSRGHKSKYESPSPSPSPGPASSQAWNPYDALGFEDLSPREQKKLEFSQLKTKRTWCVNNFHEGKQRGKSDNEKKRAADRMSEVNRAWAILGDDEKREIYDKYGLVNEDDILRKIKELDKGKQVMLRNDARESDAGRESTKGSEVGRGKGKIVKELGKELFGFGKKRK